MFADVPIAQITIGPRFRQDLGDIAALAESIERLGLLHPIIVTEAYALIVGRRRLAAHKLLGRPTIEARVVDLDAPLEAEVDENEARKDYTVSERVAIGEAREERDKADAAQRKAEGQKSGGRGKKKLGGKFPPSLDEESGKSRDITASHIGLDYKTYQKAKQVVAAAREYDELQEFVEQMDRTGSVTRAYNQLPPYAFATDEDDEAPRPRKMRRLRYLTIFKRVDRVMQNTMLPSLQDLTDAERANLYDLLRFYLTVIEKEQAQDAPGSTITTR